MIVQDTHTTFKRYALFGIISFLIPVGSAGALQVLAADSLRAEQRCESVRSTFADPALSRIDFQWNLRTVEHCRVNGPEIVAAAWKSVADTFKIRDMARTSVLMHDKRIMAVLLEVVADRRVRTSTRVWAASVLGSYTKFGKAHSTIVYRRNAASDTVVQVGGGRIMGGPSVRIGSQPVQWSREQEQRTGEQMKALSRIPGEDPFMKAVLESLGWMLTGVKG